MGLFSTLNTGASGLGVNSRGMNVIGDNIANVNTTGFKSSRINFSDLVQASGGASGSIGLGSSVAGTSTNFSQGSVETTSNVSDLSIGGKGFFVLRDPGASATTQAYTRNGSFFLDPSGRFLNSQGLFLQGYNGTESGAMGTTLQDIQINTTSINPAATDSVELSANLNSETEHTPANAINLADFGDPTLTPTFQELDEAADFATSTTIYDTLGEAHDVFYYFQRDAADNTWNYFVTTADSEIDSAHQYGVDDSAFLIESGTIEFSPDDGSIDSITVGTAGGTTAVGTVTFSGAADQALELDITEDGLVTQFGSESAVTSVVQDGYAAGYLSFLDIDAKGVVTGVYTNGERAALAQVAVANFEAEGGLSRMGNSTYGKTPNSGEPAIGTAATGGRGAVSAYTLEMSNVDLEGEFVRMIQSQTGYQANARVINTTDQMLQDLIQNIG